MQGALNGLGIVLDCKTVSDPKLFSAFRLFWALQGSPRHSSSVQYGYGRTVIRF
jgi:hypothetical protein